MKRSLHIMLAVLMGAVFALVSTQSASALQPTVYNQPGDHHVNGRYWKTTCDMYSSNVVRCTTNIWATKVVKANGTYYNHNGWVFNNMTYLPSSKASWGTNPLAKPGSWTAKDGRQWKTECNNKTTGSNGCRSYARAKMVVKSGGKYVVKNDYVFNNIVQFSAKGVPAQTKILAKSAPVKGMPVEKAFKAPAAASGSGSGGGSCSASYYWQGQMTANGERFNTNAMTAAHKTLKFGTKVKVTNPANGKSVVVRINDRGPYISGRCLDLSKAAMSSLGGISAGHIKVNYQIVS